MSQAALVPETELQTRLTRLLRGRYGESALVTAPPRRVFGGNARQAWAFDASWDGPAGPVQLPCILLAQVAGRHVESSATDEYQVLAAMTGHGVRAPAGVAVDAAGEVTGQPAVVLERVEGQADAVAFLNPADPAQSMALTRELAEITAGLHGFDWREAGLAGGEHSPRQQIEEWRARYMAARPGPNPPLTFLFNWLLENLPPARQLAQVHGDLRPGNFLYQGKRITALLDWEMAHIGDPAEDIAWIYRALWSPKRFLKLDEFLHLYEVAAGYEIEPRRLGYYRIFSEVKFATLSVVAAASFAGGRTENLRHADRAAKIPAALAQCFAWMEMSDWGGDDAAA